jgi:hypothetical protein
MNGKMILWTALIIGTILIFSTCYKRHSNPDIDLQTSTEAINPNQEYNDEKDFEVRVTNYINLPQEIEIIKYIGEAKDVRIPPYIQNIPVGRIYIGAFKDNQLVSITIPDSVNFIGTEAFYNNQLTNIKLPNKAKYIGESAFAKNKLVSITIPDRLPHISKSTFAKNKITEVIIPDSVISIRESAFLKNKITNITISKRVKIETSVFDNKTFKKFYEKNGSKPGIYTKTWSGWKVEFFEELTIEPEIKGIYEIVTAYSNIYNHYAMYEIPTEKLGIKIKVDEDNVLFGDEEYQLIDYKYSDASLGKYGDYGMMDYENFLEQHLGMNYHGFDKNIIGEDYNGRLKVMSIKNDINDYDIFFSDNKLIIEISVYLKEKETETEFKHLIKDGGDHFFYIAEKIIE